MLDQETGARGFFQTGRSVFLQPWYKGRSEFLSALTNGRALSVGDKPLLEALTEQAVLANGWHSTVGAEIARLQVTGRRPSLIENVMRKATMDSFRQVNALLADPSGQSP